MFHQHSTSATINTATPMNDLGKPQKVLFLVARPYPPPLKDSGNTFFVFFSSL